MDRINGFKAALSAVCAALTALWGWFGWLVVAWILFMTIDYITGSGAAIKSGEWSSQKARKGIWHKAGCIAAVVMAGILANLPSATLPFPYTVFLCPLVVF